MSIEGKGKVSILNVISALFDHVSEDLNCARYMADRCLQLFVLKRRGARGAAGGARVARPYHVLSR